MPAEPSPKKYRRLLKTDSVDEMWGKILTEGDPMAQRGRQFHGFIPSNPRCEACFTPFGGIGGALARLGIYGSQPSTKNPCYCTACEAFFLNYPGGAEVTLTMLFVDARGSTTLAEKMSRVDFS